MATKAGFLLSDRVVRQEVVQPFDVRAGQHAAAARGERQSLPTHRRLRIFTRDPSSSRMDVAVTETEVPYEPLKPGPAGFVIRVHDFNETTRETYDALDLDGSEAPFQFGLQPSTVDPRFAQQMCYALCMSTYERFQRALGRTPTFSFGALDGENFVRLQVRPHAFKDDNAYYDDETGELLFGYVFANRQTQGANQPGGIVFTSLSHDVVIHEMTHALLDGMRPHLLKPTNPDVEGFHEGFSDLISLFQRFRYRPMVRRAIESMGGKLTSRLLVDIARQWGETTGEGKQDPIRKAFEREGDLDEAVKKKDRYRPTLECHDMGTVLLRAVFDAFRWIYANKTARLRALGPPGDARMPAELIDLLVIEAEQLAGQFLNILIRAVDYCPPVDLKLGEYLRAIVTADFDTMPDDPWAYREAFVRAFRRYGITVDSVADLSEDALRWCTPERPLAPIQNLFDEFKVGVNEVTHADDNSEAREFRAAMLGHYITDPQFPERLYYFGLVPASTAKRIERPVIESVRILRRVSQDGAVYFDLVAEVVQRRKGANGRWVYGGSTVILDGEGFIRYLIVKNVASKDREKRVNEWLRRHPKKARFFGDNPPGSAAQFKQMHGYRRQRK